MNLSNYSAVVANISAGAEIENGLFVTQDGTSKKVVAATNAKLCVGALSAHQTMSPQTFGLDQTLAVVVQGYAVVLTGADVKQGDLLKPATDAGNIGTAIPAGNTDWAVARALHSAKVDHYVEIAYLGLIAPRGA